MNDFIRARLIQKIKNSIEEYKIARHIDHALLTGKLREIVLDDLIIPLLNNRYATATGKIIDYKGVLSTEIDIYIYSKNVHPPFFFQKEGKIAITPVESILKCIEVKSEFSKTSLQETFDKFRFIDKNLTLTPGYHDPVGNPLTYTFIRHKYDFFAFNLKAKKYSPEYILEIYKDIDPSITSICIANKGWVCFTSRGWYHMSYDAKRRINEEIIGYLSTLIQDLPNVENSRGAPRIGYYLSNSYQMDKIKDGKKMENTWSENSVLFTNDDL